MANPFKIFSIGAILGILSSIFFGQKKKQPKKDRETFTPTPSGRDSILVDNPAPNDQPGDNDDNRFDEVRDGSG